MNSCYWTEILKEPLNPTHRRINSNVTKSGRILVYFFKQNDDFFVLSYFVIYSVNFTEIIMCMSMYHRYFNIFNVVFFFMKFDFLAFYEK